MWRDGLKKKELKNPSVLSQPSYSGMAISNQSAHLSLPRCIFDFPACGLSLLVAAVIDFPPLTNDPDLNNVFVPPGLAGMGLPGALGRIGRVERGSGRKERAAVRSVCT